MSPNILDLILSSKREQLTVTKERHPRESLLKSIGEESPPSLSAALGRDGLNIISEIKYRSPSRGLFACKMEPEGIARDYVVNGAVALSILTEEKYFSGQPEYLQRVHGLLPETPLLRKDFLFDTYQVVESRAWGASAILAIVACLDVQQLASLLDCARDLELSALVEIHDERELEIAVEAGARLIGVNNRNLKDFQVNVSTSFNIARRLEGESGFQLVSESGLSERSQLIELREAGFCAFLIGSYFMESQKPGQKLAGLLDRAPIETTGYDADDVLR